MNEEKKRELQKAIDYFNTLPFKRIKAKIGNLELNIPVIGPIEVQSREYTMGIWENGNGYLLEYMNFDEFRVQRDDKTHEIYITLIYDERIIQYKSVIYLISKKEK